MEISSNGRLLIREAFEKVQDRYRITMASISAVQGFAGKVELVLDLVDEVISSMPFARWDGDSGRYSSLDGYTFRLFNGRYYEKVYSKDIVSETLRFLSRGGIPPTVRLKLSNSIGVQVLNAIRGKRLEPRLTLMCFTNGVVDFAERGKLSLKPFDMSYDVVKQYDFPFDLRSYRSCPLWKNFLGESVNCRSNVEGVLPELSKRRQLQMFLGSILMDRNRASFEYFMILQGDGGNGKSVIFRVLESLFGSDEVSVLSLSQLSRPGDERMRAAANLVGKRLMYCPEETTKSSVQFANIKSLVSGEPIEMRKIGCDVEQVQSPPIIMFNTNHRWKASDFVGGSDPNDQSLLRRVKIINFERSIPVEKRDTHLVDRLRDEKAGIFAWIVKGFLELKRNKYRMPESKQGRVDVLLEKARSKVSVGDREVSGIVALYMERKKAQPYYSYGWFKVDVPYDKLFQNFCCFCENEGLESVSTQKFSRDLGSLGYEKVKSSAKGGQMSYVIYCTEENAAINFILEVPAILDEAEVKIFEGDDYTDDEFDEYIESDESASSGK